MLQTPETISATETLELIKEAITETSYSGYHEIDAEDCKVMGITLPLHGVGRDAFAARAHGLSANLCVVDGAMTDSEGDIRPSTERVEAELLTHALLNMSLSQSDHPLRKTNRHTNVIANTGGNRDMLLPFAALHKTGNHVEWLGNGDTYIIAFIPQEFSGGYFGKEKRYTVKVLHYSDKINYSSINPKYSSDHEKFSGNYFQDMGGEFDFPQGSIFLLSTDGGIEGLQSIVRKQSEGKNTLFKSVPERLLYKYEMLPDEGATREQIEKALAPVAYYLTLLVFDEHESEYHAVKKLLSELLQPHLQQSFQDDSSLLFYVDKSKTEKGIEKNFSPELKLQLSKKLYPLVYNLLEDEFHLPFHEKDLLDKYPERLINQLVEELVHNGLTNGYLFVRACALVRFHQLNTVTQEWFQKNGIQIIPDATFHLHLRWIPTKNGLRACHEIADLMITGKASGKWDLDENGAPKYVSPEKFKPIFPSETHSKGSLILFKPFTGIPYIISGPYVAGGKENSRGIVIPGDKDGLYIASTETSDHIDDPHHTLDLFCVHEQVFTTVWEASAAVAKYLRGEIPSKEEYIRDHSE